MILSKKFIQGSKVAAFVNSNQNAGFFLYRINGEFILLYSTNPAVNFYPDYDKTNLTTWLAAANNDADKMVLLNGFTIEDAGLCSPKTTLTGKYSAVLGAYNNTLLKLGTLPTGYVEPENVISIDDPTLAPILAYSVYLKGLLKENKIPYKGLELPS